MSRKEDEYTEIERQTEEKTLIDGAEHIYEDDGLLVLYVKRLAPSGIVDPTVVDEVIRETCEQRGWNLYFRADKHSVVYLLFLF